MLATNTLYHGDCLDVIDKAIETGQEAFIDLIYLDPPFFTGKTQTGGKSQKRKGLYFQDDRKEFAPSQKTHWEQLLPLNEHYQTLKELLYFTQATRGKDAAHYLLYMAKRLFCLYKVLKPTGSLYLHCDTHYSHYLKALLDLIFGHKRLINELVWCYSGPSSSQRKFKQKHDTIFLYSKSKDYHFFADKVRIPFVDGAPHIGGVGKGIRTKEQQALFAEKGRIPDSWWYIAPAGLGNQYVGYPTQKPLLLLHRIIRASCPQDGTLLDPFCGSGTSILVAQMLNTKWIAIDKSMDAINTAHKRLQQKDPLTRQLITIKSFS